MSDFPIEREDVAAMRRENGGSDFRLLLRQQIADGRTRRTQPAPPAARPLPPGRRPGAWPPGLSPPPPIPEAPPGAWGAAVARYRRDLDAGAPPFECHGCTPTTEETR
ncbi:hypothetical protein ACIOEX_01305 [Streptomyces sp. NPDC087850]|uniref:hypothetical protein n=1 Tax=Streptomyces sp. NPDC087850 TaxID=3365809 RepID=UPI0038127384